MAMLSQGMSLSGILTLNQLLFVVVALCVLGVIFSMPLRKTVYKQILVLAACAFFMVMAMSWRDKSTVSAENTTEVAEVQVETVDGVQLGSCAKSRDDRWL